jgi:hypothetical protein
VPSALSTCRCGGKRSEAWPGAAQPPATSRASSGGGSDASPAWVGKVLTVLAVVAVYFGSRGCNRYVASREAREAALEALTEAMGPEEARAIVEAHHAACFDEHYKTGWGRRSKSSFDGEKYASCMVRRAESQVTELKLAAAKATRRRAAPTPRATSRPVPVSIPPPTPTPDPAVSMLVGATEDYGQVVVGDARLLDFQRAPQLTVRLSFTAVGRTEALRRYGLCSHVVRCEGRAFDSSPGQRMVLPCPLQVAGAKGTGEIHFALADPAPAEGACSIELALTDGHQVRSNTIEMPLTP